MLWLWVGCNEIPDDTIVVTEPAACAGGQAGFAGVDLPMPSADASTLRGGGVLLADLDGDERPELIALGVQPAVGWWDGVGYLLDGGAIPEGLATFATGGAAADVDADGDLDVLITRDGLPLTLLHNVDGTLVDATTDSGLHDARASVAAAFGDADGDGDLDLAVGAWGQGTRLFVNDGTGRFEDRTDLLPASLAAAWVLQVGWVDLDDDGALDLVSIHDHPAEVPSAALRWDGSRFVDVGLGLLTGFAGMGLGVGDIEGDGLVDLLVPGLDDVALLRPVVTEDGIAFLDRADALGVSPPGGMAWSAHLADLDDDGHVDAFSSLGDWGEASGGPREALWVGGASGFAVAAPTDWGLGGTGAGRGGQVADIDGDGRLDAVVAAADGPWSCYRGACGEGAFLVVRPRWAEGTNRFAVGSRVCATAGDVSRCGWVMAGGQGMFGSGPPEVHLGVGDADVVDAVEVRWPDGVVQRWTGVETRSVVTLRRVD